ncbi:MAG: hypothetical protein ABFS34_06565 [Gemmatimonadota bacterium]
MGRALRLVVGIALTVEGGRHLVGTSAALMLKTAGVIVGVAAFYAAMHFVIDRYFRRLNPWIGAMLAVAPVAAVFLMSDAPGRLGSLIFLGVSLVLASIRADGGCEVMTVPGMMFGRHTHLFCLAFSPVDWAEATWAGRGTHAHPSRDSDE